MAWSMWARMTDPLCVRRRGEHQLSGTPKICAPLWTAHAGGESSPTVANGVVYIGSGNNLYAFDACGQRQLFRQPEGLRAPVDRQNWKHRHLVASGVRRRCLCGVLGPQALCFRRRRKHQLLGIAQGLRPPWTASTGNVVFSSPAVSNGVVYVGSWDDNLYAFDAAGHLNCSGTPKICAPLWRDPTGGPVSASPVIANNVIYVGSDDDKLYAFDAGGKTNCSGTPTTCNPLWTATTSGGIDSSPAVANGVIFVGSLDHNLYAFDAAGSAGCSGTPTTCTPLWTATTGARLLGSVAVANNVVYVGSSDYNLYAYGLP